MCSSDLAPLIVAEANPETYITPSCPPFLIEAGKEDQFVPYQQAVNFAKKLEAVIGKDKVTLVIIPDAGHGGTAFTSEANLKLVYNFLDKFVKGVK